MDLTKYSEIWLVDFEFHQPDGERPDPICMVAYERHSGRTVRLGPDELRVRSTAPFGTGPEVLLVAYFSSAELGCFLALDWPLPSNVLDLYVEFSCLTNGRQRVAGRGLLGALVWYGLSGIPFAVKEEMRQLAVRGGAYSSPEIAALLSYCESDVRALRALLPVMAPHIHAGRALLRGRYMIAVARMEAIGVPVDAPLLAALRANWEAVRVGLIEAVCSEYYAIDAENNRHPVFDGTTFKHDRFARYLEQHDISWPRLTTERLDLSDDTFRRMAKVYPAISPLRETRHALAQLRLTDLTVGSAGRNRVMLSPFASRTSRNQPSTSKFIFGSSVWLRGLIRPQPGTALAYIDWSGQEYGIAAALSGDERMMADYCTGDPYLGFAKQIGAVPLDATKQTHPVERGVHKVALGLGAMYGAGPSTVATMINRSVADAAHLLQMHRQTYPRFWRWRDAVVTHAMLHNQLHTVFGWQVQVGPDTNPRSLSNYLMQANGAEMLRLACIYATKAGVRVCCPVHDALLVEGPLNRIEEVVAETQRLMTKASRDVLTGFELRTGVEIVTYPNRYRDEKRGGVMWDRVMHLLALNSGLTR